jgi:hypothetical protein
MFNSPERLDRLVGAEALDELGVGFRELGAKGVGRVVGRRQPFGKLSEPQPRRDADDRRFGRFDVLVE